MAILKKKNLSHTQQKELRMEEMKKRIVELEIKFSQQENLLTDLSDIVGKQQRVIDSLCLQIGGLAETMGGTSESRSLSDDKPPHY